MSGFGLLFTLVACKGPDAGSEDDSSGKTQDSVADSVPDVPRASLQFRVPLTEPERFTQVIGVDHDPTVYEGADQLRCKNYDGHAFPWCYDEHDGSDFIFEGGFEAMDAGSTPIVAAADGVVVKAEDGHYDRCHGSLETGSVDCDGNDGIANAVILENTDSDGVVWRTLYWHMKNGSVAVEVGDTVTAGTQLGLVGSSGNSTLPHLHFELQDADHVVVDPYAGDWSQPETWWCQQNEPDEMPGLCD